MKVRTARKIITNSLQVYIPSLTELEQVNAVYKIEKGGRVLLAIKNNYRLHYSDHQHKMAMKLMKKAVRKILREE